jgi:RNA polymerase sigma-70 factor (ECF subfamily)
MTTLPNVATDRTETSPATLGDVLYAKSRPVASEEDWAALVRSIAAGDQTALYALYDRTHRIVFTLAMRLTANRETAEDVTIDVFHDIWRRAADYDAANETVLGWVMNRARARALDRQRIETQRKNEHAETLRAALTALTPGERQAIETTFFGGLTHDEAAVRLNQPPGTIKTRIYSGLNKLRSTLGVKRNDEYV